MKDKTPYLTGRLLLAMPAMTDPRFHRAVILICAHDENGAMGLVINNPLLGVDFAALLKQLNIQAGPGLSTKNFMVMSGGPVESVRGFLLHGPEFHGPGTISINDTFGVTGTVEALSAIANGKGPDKVLFILGYAGWTAGQLERELQENAWLVTDGAPEIVFHADASQKWQMAMQHLGINPAMLSSVAGRA
jgi:putative transcriptional regulator